MPELILLLDQSECQAEEKVKTVNQMHYAYAIMN